LKILRVGDPHIKPSNLKDAERLINFIIETATKRKIDIIEFLGDLFHTHAILRIEVVDFWTNTFKMLEDAQIECRVLVGNHDQPGSYEKEQLMNALNIFQKTSGIGGERFIINKSMIIDQIGYIPYMSSQEAFLNASKALYNQGATKLLVAHQTFTGATYENGFYAEDGLDPALVSQEAIISGHIHKNQQIGKCDYPGTPKWDTMSDANEEKGIWIYTHEKDGSIKEKEFISTREIVSPIYKYTVYEGDIEPKLVENSRNYIEFIGKIAWINKMKKKYKGKVQIKARPTDRKKTNISKNRKLDIKLYLADEFEPIDGVNKINISQYWESLDGK